MVYCTKEFTTGLSRVSHVLQLLLGKRLYNGQQMNYPGRNFNNLCYTNDAVLTVTPSETLQTLLDEMERVSGGFRLEISTRTKKVIAYNWVTDTVKHSALRRLADLS